MKSHFFIIIILMSLLGCQNSPNVTPSYETYTNIEQTTSQLLTILIKPEDIQNPNLQWNRFVISQSPRGAESNEPYFESASTFIIGSFPETDSVVVITQKVYKYFKNQDGLNYVSKKQVEKMDALTINASDLTTQTFEDKTVLFGCDKNLDDVKMCLIITQYSNFISFFTLSFSNYQPKNDEIMQVMLVKITEKINENISQ